MAWTTPLTAVSNATLTAAQWNASVRDNLLETASAKATAAGRLFRTTGANSLAESVVSGQTVSTGQTTTSTSYADLTTVGPAVTVTTGTLAFVVVGAILSVDTTGNRVLTSYAVSSATTIAASDDTTVAQDASSTGRILSASRATLQASLTGGSNIFTQKYRVSGGTGTFSGRHIAVIPL